MIGVFPISFSNCEPQLFGGIVNVRNENDALHPTGLRSQKYETRTQHQQHLNFHTMLAARRLPTMLPRVGLAPRLTLWKRLESTAASALRHCRTSQVLKGTTNVVPKALSTLMEGPRSHGLHDDFHQEKIREAMLYQAIHKFRACSK